MASPVFTIDLSGDKELIRALKKLPAVVERRIFRKAFRVGAKRIKEQAKATVPVLTGALRDSIKVRAPKKRIRNAVRVIVSSSATDVLNQGDQYYGGFLELGFKHWISGEKIDDPFLRPAFEEVAPQVERDVIQKIKTELPKEARKLALKVIK